MKCDERKPTCQNCQKGNRECLPADTLIFRNHHNPSINQDTEDDVPGLDKYYAYKESFAPDAFWVPIPSQLTFVNVADPFEYEEEAESRNDAVPGYQQMATHTLEALSTAATRESPQFAAAYPATTYADAGYSYSAAPYLTNQSPYAANIDPNLEKAGKGKEEESVASLLRRLSEEGV
jgi:hypothetical protein